MAPSNNRFSLTIKPEELIKGIKPYSKVPRNAKYLDECVGAIGFDGTLQTLEELSEISLPITGSESYISGSFPYPQIFVLTNLIIVCNSTTIYEKDGSTYDEKLVVTAGSTWSLVDFYDYVYMSNGNVAVIRDAQSKVYSLTTELPTAMAMCNYNGQVIIGAPDVHI